MKKIILLFILGFILIYFLNDEYIYIPNDSIRLRIIANDNSSYSQGLKFKYNIKLNEYLLNLTKDSNNLSDINNIISNNLDNINNFTLQFLIENNMSDSFNVNYGKNYFPDKEYKGIKYSSGYYESLVVTFGEGKGNNWWCVLFPPLCNFEDDSLKNVNYKSYIKEIVNKYS